MRTLAVTQNVTLDGSIEMLGDWFDPEAQSSVEAQDLVEEVQRQYEQADALVVGRRTFELLRGYWPHVSDDPTGVGDYLDRVRKHVVSSTLTTRSGRTRRCCPAIPSRRPGR